MIWSNFPTNCQVEKSNDSTVAQVVFVLVVYRLCGLVKVETLVSLVFLTAVLCSSSLFCRNLSFKSYLLQLSSRLYRLLCLDFLFGPLIIILVAAVLGFCW